MKQERGPLAAWIEERTGWLSAISRLGAAHVPGGASWVRSFGAALVFLFIAQLSSGVGLAIRYAPTSTSAWESVARIDSTPWGHFLRSLHAHGADLIVLALLLHLLQTAVHGAFRAPRELTWWLGVVLALICLGAAFTGALLPWDERARVALAVARGTAASVPLLGPLALKLFAGTGGAGPASGGGNVVLPRVFALHAILAPLCIGGLVLLHISLARRHGSVPPPSLSPAGRNLRHYYWPKQALADATISFAALFILGYLALMRGAPLAGPFDPSGPLDGVRPFWYFRPLSELLRDLPAPLVLILPGLTLILLLVLPLFPSKRAQTAPVSPLRNPGYLLALLLAISAGLGVSSFVRDLRNPKMRAEQANSEARAQLARGLASAGTPAEGILFTLANQAPSRGARIFERRCLACHRVGERGAQFGPGLTDYLSREWMKGLVTDATAPDYFGKSGLTGMEPQELDADSLGLIVELLHSLRDLPEGAHALPPALEGARRIFETARCNRCHAIEPGQTSLGPSLVGYGSAAWLQGLLHDPASPAYFGKQNKMEIAGGELSEIERSDLVAYLQTLETR